MAQIKIYPSTQAQVQAVQNTVDEINSKIVTPNYQVKTVTPSDVQQTIQADNGYTALSGVVVNPIAAGMPENLKDYIMRKDPVPKFSLSLNGDIPDYACYGQKYLKAVYGNITSIGISAFENSRIEQIDTRNTYMFGYHCFLSSQLSFLSAPSLLTGDVVECFYQSNLKIVIFKNLKNATANYFLSSTKCEYADLRNLETISGYNTLHMGSNIKLIDISNVDNPPSLSSSNAINTSSDYIIAVKNDAVKSLFQSATNWSLVSNKVKTIAEIETLYGDTYDNLYELWFGVPRFDENEVN
jgi:hypothetical protein